MSKNYRCTKQSFTTFTINPTLTNDANVLQTKDNWPVNKVVKPGRKRNDQKQSKGASQRIKCDQCQKTFSCKDNLQDHMNIHMGIKPHVCNVCNKAFRTFSNLYRHKKKHRPPDPLLRCDQCQKTFTCKESLQFHINIHKGVKPFVCDGCSKAFYSGNSLRLHKKKHNPSDQLLRCDHCQKTFIRKDALQYHMNIHTGDKPHVCNVCNKGFPSSSTLYRHKKKHEPADPLLRCDQCQKSFGSKEILQSHLNVHTGIKPTHVCNVCRKAFYYSSSLLQHKMKHKPNNSHLRCPHCQKVLSSKSILKKHMNIHTGVKPHVCNVCRKAFHYLSNLRRHKKEHKPAGPLLRCDPCEKSYTTREELDEHTMSAHSDISPKANV